MGCCISALAFQRKALLHVLETLAQSERKMHHHISDYVGEEERHEAGFISVQDEAQLHGP